MARLILVVALLTLGGCALLLPPACREGRQIRAVATDLGPVYVCEKRTDDHQP